MWGLTQRIEQMSGQTFLINQGSLYPALERLTRKGWIRALLFGARADRATAAAVAMWVPAWRAARMSAMEALRVE